MKTSKSSTPAMIARYIIILCYVLQPLVQGLLPTRHHHILLGSNHFPLRASSTIDTADIAPLHSSLPRSYIIISNLQSGSNIGSICRNALAFNVHEVIIVGRRDFRSKMRQADRGAKERQKFTHFNSIAEARTYLKEESNATIIGIEIMDSAVSLTAQPLSQSTAFMFGNEGGGLSERQREACDRFVYIPQYAAGGMASINVACASAVVLQSFAVWAGFEETQRCGEKFL